MRGIGQSFCRTNSASLAHPGGRLYELHIDSAIERILAAHTVHVIGLDRSFPVAAYFAYAFHRANVRTIQITGMGTLATEQVATMRPGDLLVSISFPPYARQTIDATRAARAAGRDVIAITDSPVSPITEAAAEVLTVEDAALHGFRSLTAVMSLVQTMEFPRFRGHKSAFIEGVHMPRTRTPYPADFRDQIIALAGAGRSVESLAREFEPCAATIAGWVRQSGIDGGARIDGPTSPELEELRRLRKENRRLRMERDILSKAAAWFARDELGSSRSSN